MIVNSRVWAFTTTIYSIITAENSTTLMQINNAWLAFPSIQHYVADSAAPLSMFPVGNKCNTRHSKYRPRNMTEELPMELIY